MSRAVNLQRQPDRVPGTNFEYIEAHAYRERDRTAVQSGGTKVSYAKLRNDVMAFACLLHQRGVRPAHRLGVNAMDSYVHWVVLLAAETLGAVTCSLHHSEALVSLGSVVNFVDFWVGEKPLVEVAEPARLILLDGLLTKQTFSTPLDSAYFDRIFQPLALDDGQRLRRSSGTTGGMKLMLSTRRVEESRMRAYAEFMGLTPDSRYMVSRTFIISSAYLTANLCLRLGAMVMFDSGADRITQIAQYGITHLRLFQDQLLKLLEDIEAHQSPKPPGVTLILGAAPVSQALWDKALEKFATRIAYTYNANECGSICFMGPQGRGVVRPGVIVQVLDEDDQPLPTGQAGRLRVKTPSQLSGYLDNPQMSQQNFREGWFYTGDMGILHSERELELIGRADDVINLSGYKHSSPAVEDALMKVPGVKEVCATTGRNALGVDHLALLVVLQAGASQAETTQLILASFPDFLAKTLKIFFVPHLLRTESGKLRRKAMGHMLKPD